MQYVRRGRCPHRPGGGQSQSCKNHRRQRKTFCRGGRLCPPDGQPQIFRCVSQKRSCVIRVDVGIDPYKRIAYLHRCIRFLWVCCAGRTESSASTGACRSALFAALYRRERQAPPLRYNNSFTFPLKSSHPRRSSRPSTGRTCRLLAAPFWRRAPVLRSRGPPCARR